MLLYQDMQSYCYNSDTHFLYNFVCQCFDDFKNISGELLDVGSGCGILGLLVARDYPKLKLNQAEIYPKMQFLSRKNSEINKINSQLFAGNFADIDFGKLFDFVISNPPFYHKGSIMSQNEHMQKARYNESLPLEILISKVAQILNNGGKFAFCYDVKQIADIIFVLRQNNLSIEKMQFVHPKIDKKSTLVMIFARKNVKSLMSLLPPLIAFDDKEYSEEAKNIYKKSATHSIKVEL